MRVVHTGVLKIVRILLATNLLKMVHVLMWNASQDIKETTVPQVTRKHFFCSEIHHRFLQKIWDLFESRI